MKRECGLGRRAVLACVAAWCALGVGAVLAAAPSGGRGAAASAPATRGVTAVDRKAAEDQFDKANALYKQGRFNEAQAENEKALGLDPVNTNALLMRQVLEGKIAESGGGSGAGRGTGGGSATTPGKVNLLAAQQVSQIRAMEAGLNDRLTGKFDPKVLEDFWSSVMLKDPLEDKSKGAHDRFVSAANFLQQLARIKQANENKYLQGATITTDPAVLKAFTAGGGVNTFVLQNCATAECHASSSKQAGNFRLINPTTNAEAQYTNFYILSMYSNADGKMIDRDNPEKSLLLQYSLPYAAATARHPKSDVRRLTGLNDARLRSMNDWIKSLAFPKPNYGIVYEVPGMSATPASAPSTRPGK